MLLIVLCVLLAVGAVEKKHLQICCEEYEQIRLVDHVVQLRNTESEEKEFFDDNDVENGVVDDELILTTLRFKNTRGLKTWSLRGLFDQSLHISEEP